MAVGGNGSGKTYCGAQKCAEFLHTTEPQTKDMPFWVIGGSYEQVCSTCWFQKLREILPAHWIDQERISWYSSKRQWPYSVPLLPWPNGNNWILEFKSYEQGREAMQANAIGGAWFTEQFPYSVFEEVLRGVREFALPGSIWMEFTPIDPEKSVPIQEMYEHWTVGDKRAANWQFFHLNTESALKSGHVEQAWFDTFFGSISDEMLDTRLRGAFASYEGAIYKSFIPRIHLVDGIELAEGCIHKRAIDWGASEDHPFVCLWGAKDGLGCWWIYDEFWSNSQTELIEDKVEEIKSRHPWPHQPWYQETYGDPSRPDMFREFGSRGIPISAANNAVHEGIETVRRHLKISEVLDAPRLFIDRTRCPKLAREMSTYRWKRSSLSGVNPQAAKPEPLKKNDDCVDALRYLLHTDSTGGARGAKAIWVPLRNRESVRHKKVKQ